MTNSLKSGDNWKKFIGDSISAARYNRDVLINIILYLRPSLFISNINKLFHFMFNILFINTFYFFFSTIQGNLC